MLIALSILGYLVLGVVWVFYCIMYAPKDIAMAFYEDYHKDSIDHGWLLLNLLFWPIVMFSMVVWLLGCLLSVGFVKRILDKRFGK